LFKENDIMSPMNRRAFGRTCLGMTALAATAPAALVQAADLPHVDPASPQAQALGYVADAGKVDTAKFANFVAGSACASCALYQGGAEFGGCGIFPGQQVAAAGWCSAYAKKPA
jgi:hypothetical protein